jgi:hypothetical protein
VVGQQEFGSTTDGCYQTCQPGDIYYTPADFWKLSLIAADHVKVDWEPTADNCDADEFTVWPIGTTDYSINTANPVQQTGAGGNGKGESRFTVKSTGVYPLMFSDGCENFAVGGPYDFTVYVRHLPVLQFRAPTSITSKTSVTVQVHYADGRAISDMRLRVSIRGWWQRKWHTIGTGSPASGRTRIHLRAPIHKRIRVEAVASGSGYVSTHTKSLTTLMK